jgi:hypothetical protein
MDDDTHFQWLLGLILGLVAIVVLFKVAPKLTSRFQSVEEPLDTITPPPTLQMLREADALQKWTIVPETLVIGGVAYNCESYLDAVLTNIQRIGSLFSDYVVVIVIDEATNGSMSRLRYWQTQLPRLVILVEQKSRARARNRILQFIRELMKNTVVNYFVMMDCEDVCAAPIHLPLLQHVLLRSDEWEAVTFPNDNKSMWETLACAPFVLNYRHFAAQGFTPPHERALTRMKNFMYRKLGQQEWIPCASSFGGLAVYKTHPFLECSYDHSFSRNLRFWTPDQIRANERACGSRLGYSTATTNDQDEDSEHRFFHLSGVLRHRARMFIVPYVLFPPTSP